MAAQLPQHQFQQQATNMRPPELTTSYQPPRGQYSEPPQHSAQQEAILPPWPSTASYQPQQPPHYPSMQHLIKDHARAYTQIPSQHNGVVEQRLGKRRRRWDDSLGKENNRSGPTQCERVDGTKGRQEQVTSEDSRDVERSRKPALLAQLKVEASDPLAAANAVMERLKKHEEEQARQNEAELSQQDDQDEEEQAVKLASNAYEKRRTFHVTKDDGTIAHHIQVPIGHYLGGNFTMYNLVSRNLIKDYIPRAELEQFMQKAQGADTQGHQQTKAAGGIDSSNIGRKLLQKMGWKEGEGLGQSQKGISAPITAGQVKQNNAGLGIEDDDEVRPDDDEYTKYRKRMKLGYKYRPNPLGNPRKQYY